MVTPLSESEVYALVRDCTHKISNPLYHAWDTVRQLAILILRHMGIYVGDGFRQESMVGVLVDMNRALEIYFEQILKPLEKGNLEVKIQSQPEVDGLFPRTDNSGCKWHFRPDFLIQSKGKNLAVLDVKNKQEWGDLLFSGEWPKNDGYSYFRENLYQVLAYMYAMHYPIGGIVCVYNSGKEQDSVIVQYSVSKECTDKFCVLGIDVSSGESDSDNTFEAYVRKMKKREAEFIEKVKDLLSGNDRCFDGKSFMDIEADVTVDAILAES